MNCHLQSLALLVLFLSAAPAYAGDWFVCAGSEGNGTIEQPFKDPYLALEEAGPGDTIHVAQGVYHGKLDAANWVIASPNLTWLGGYNADFTQRDPWHFPSQLRFSKEFRGKNSGTLIEGQGSHENFVLDGFVLDQKEANEYAPEPDASLTSPRSDPIIRLSAPGTQMRNCVILNGSDGGADLQADGCRIENNLILNISRNALINFRSHQGNPTLIRNNTFLFAWSDSGVGSGGTPAGSALSFWSCDSEFEIVDNIFLGCDNRAIHANQAEQLTLKGNVFWLNGWLNAQVQTKEQELRVETSNLSDLDDAGLKACQGNLVANPELTGLDLLVNAGGPAIEAWGDNMRIENNIILNSNYYAIDIRGVTDHPFIIRNNTILFTWNATPERGNSAGTSIFVHEGALFELDGNIIGYADGQAVLAATDRKRLRIVNNVFTHNRYANFTDLDKVVVDDKSMSLLQEMGFAAADGNVVLDPQMSFEGTWWADYSREGGAPFFARPYDWKAGLYLLSHNPGCKAGARPLKLDVQLSQ